MKLIVVPLVEPAALPTAIGGVISPPFTPSSNTSVSFDFLSEEVKFLRENCHLSYLSVFQLESRGARQRAREAAAQRLLRTGVWQRWVYVQQRGQWQRTSLASSKGLLQKSVSLMLDGGGCKSYTCLDG